jgi:uncharacterized repeat protein (TIGR03803 family)
LQLNELGGLKTLDRSFYPAARYRNDGQTRGFLPRSVVEMKPIRRVLTMIAFTLLGIGAGSAAAQENILYNFAGNPADGSQPTAGLISDAKGNLYGTTEYGGANSNGAVFELSPAEGGGWTETLLFSFNQATDGSEPLGSLVLDKDGNLYGTASYGGTNGGGTVFELSPGAGGVWTFNLLYSFGPGNGNGESGPSYPKANLILDTKGNLYGTSESGGLNNFGTVFELSPSTGGDWTLNVLHTFYTGSNATNDGQFPYGGLIFDTKGNLYGTTSGGGANGSLSGTVFELSPAAGGTWTESVLWSFNTPSDGDATHPAAALVFDAQGNLYGTSTQGGNNGTNDGAVFELSPGAGGAWTEKVLWNFSGGPADGSVPYCNLVLDAQGNLYGTTYSGGSNGYVINNGYVLGTVFELSPTAGGTWTETILHDFYATASDGFNPDDGLLADSAGNLYGTTQLGGSYYSTLNRYQNWGTVFEIGAAALPVFSPVAGTYVGAQSVTITSATNNAAIYYTTDGTTPTTLSTRYSGSIPVAASETIKAFATIAGYPNSAVASADYIIVVKPTVEVTPSSNSIFTTQPLTVTITVGGPGGDPTPTGTVTLGSGSYSSAAATLSGGSATIVIPAGSLASGSGSVTFETDTLTATYTPDSSGSLYYADANGTGSVTVTKAFPSVRFTLSPSTVTTEQALTVHVVVSGGSGNPTPTGSVIFCYSSVGFAALPGRPRKGAVAVAPDAANPCPYLSAAVTLIDGSASIIIPAGSLPAGTDAFEVSYTPDSAGSKIYAAWASTGSVIVTKATPVVTLTPSAKTITTREPLTVTVAVSGGSGATAPTGSVTLTSGAYTSAAVALSSGSATITVPAGSLAVGQDTLTVKYAPDTAGSANYNGATGTGSVMVTKVTPTVALTLSSKSITTRQALTVTVAVNGGSGNPTPTGSVTLSSGAYTSAAAALSSGGATITVPAGSLAVGSDKLTVSYIPDSASSPNYNSATGTGSVTVATTTTPSVSLTASAKSVTTRQALTVTVAVSGGSGNPTPTGSVILTSGSFTSAAGTLSGGSATISIPAGSLAVGSDTLTATYTPDSASSTTYNTGAGTSSVSVTSPITPTVTLSAASSITTVQALTVSVAVNGGSGSPTPTGSVTLTSGSYTSAAATLSSGSATISVPAGSLAAGSDTLKVTYTANSASSPIYNGSTGTGSVSVTKATPALNVTASEKTITTADSLTVTATVSSGAGNPVPSGTVQLAGGGYTSAAETLASGSYTFAIPANSLSAGKDTLTVSYSGNSDYALGSGTVSVIVTLPLTPTLKVTPSVTTLVLTSTLNVMAAVSGTGATPTGTVKLSGGGYTSGSQTLTNGSYSFAIPANSLSVGTDTLTVSYSGDSNYAAGTGSASISVLAAPLTPTVTVTPAAASLDSSSSLSVTTSVSGAGVTPTGTVTLSGGGYTSASQTLTNGSSTFTIPANSLSVGVDTLSVSYSGDSIYGTGSGTASVAVTASVFTLAATSPSAVSPGSPATSTVTVSTTTGYTGTITLACALTSSPTGSKHLPTCSSGSSTVTLNNGATTGTATVTISSTSSNGTVAKSNGPGWAGGAVLALLVIIGIPARRRHWRSMLGVLALMAVLGSLAACGGSSSATTAGNYTFTVTATGSPSVTPSPTTTFTVTIN